MHRLPCRQSADRGRSAVDRAIELNEFDLPLAHTIPAGCPAPLAASLAIAKSFLDVFHKPMMD
jgi:DNA repair protein RadC